MEARSRAPLVWQNRHSPVDPGKTAEPAFKGRSGRVNDYAAARKVSHVTRSCGTHKPSSMAAWDDQHGARTDAGLAMVARVVCSPRFSLGYDLVLGFPALFCGTCP